MTRLLVLALFVLVAFAAVVSRLQPLLRAAGELFRPPREPGPSPGASGLPAGERLVACAACGARVPVSRALGDAGTGHYCSSECRRRESRPPGRLAG